MKVLIINGSPRKDGNTSIVVNELVKTFQTEGIETEVCQTGNKDIRGCVACADVLQPWQGKIRLPEKEAWQPTHFIR